jgi:hypothetical protein
LYVSLATVQQNKKTWPRTISYLLACRKVWRFQRRCLAATGSKFVLKCRRPLHDWMLLGNGLSVGVAASAIPAVAAKAPT